MNSRPLFNSGNAKALLDAIMVIIHFQLMIEGTKIYDEGSLESVNDDEGTQILISFAVA